MLESEVGNMCNLSNGVMETGRRKGRAEGRAEGRVEGRKYEQRATAVRLLKKRADISFIREITELPTEQILSLARENGIAVSGESTEN